MDSIKLELRHDIAKLTASLDKFSDTMREEHRRIDDKFYSLTNRVDNLEKSVTRNNEWVDMGKRVAYTIAGALALGLLYAMGLQIK
jgi:predicted RNase H-like nuclease (RuvC/YqgF family)